VPAKSSLKGECVSVVLEMILEMKCIHVTNAFKTNCVVLVFLKSTISQ